MSNQINDGGPAFPIQIHASPDSDFSPGMTLRDWFAGMALSSMTYEWFESYKRAQEMATEAYAIADAALAVRAPAEPEWIPWNGGDCPVEPTSGTARFRNRGEAYFNDLTLLNWKHGSTMRPDGEIIAYRIGGQP